MSAENRQYAVAGMAKTKIPKGCRKVSIDLFERQIAQLDRLAVDIRLRHGAAISRAAIIRALIEVKMAECRFDQRGVSSRYGR